MSRRSWALSAAVLLGCGSSEPRVVAPPIASASATSVEAAPTTTLRRQAPEDLLDDRVVERHALRAWLIKNDPLVYAEGRASIARSPDKEEMKNAVDVFVVEQVGDQLRVVLDGQEVRLVFLAPAPCFAIVVKRAAWLSRSDTVAPNADEGVRLAAGVRLFETTARAGKRQVYGVADGVAFDGWLDDEAVDRAFVEAPFPRGREDGLVSRGAEVVDQKGSRIVDLPLEKSNSGGRAFEHRVETGTREKNGYKYIIYRSKAVEVRGFVRNADYQPLPLDASRSTTGTGWGDGGGMSGFMTARLEPGTILHDEEGARVGKVKKETTLYLIQGNPDPEAAPETRVEGWVHATGIGFVYAWVRKEDLRQR